MNSPLPIDEVLPRLKKALSASGAAVLQAPPGAGKTTRVPLALLDEPWLVGKSILMLEPRRLAASNAARFMARQLREPVGQTVGYAIRYERRVSRSTRIEVVTEGILTRRLQSDPELAGVGLVIFDEFHERNLNSDLALALCFDAQQGLREDLKLLVMSATLDAEPVAKLLGDCPLVTSAGRSHPVDIRYLPQPPRTPVADAVAAAVRRALSETDGDILAFLPGAGEIRRCAERLTGVEAQVCPLYGNLSFAEQERAILPGERRKVVLATNIAETSLTIEGVKTVVDGGFERRPTFDAASGLNRLELVRISAASAVQRAGRAGRLAPGNCYRLWSQGEQGALLPFTPPEIRSADLAPLTLDLARWGVNDAASLCWLDPPPGGHLTAARGLLQLLGAMDGSGHVTRLGQAMARFACHPRLARLLLAAVEGGRPDLGSDLVALLSERDLLAGDGTGPRHGSPSDLLDRLQLLHRGGKGSFAVSRAARYWRQKTGAGKDEPAPDETSVGRLLALAFPDRIGQRRGEGGGRYLLSGGQGARISPRSAVQGAEWLVAVEVAGRAGQEGEIRLASALALEDVEELFGRDLAWRREVEWDEGQGRVVARELRRLGALVLQQRPVAAGAEDAVPALLQVLRRKGLELLGWSRETQQLRARVAFLARTFPGDWPDLSDAGLLGSLEAWLAPFLSGVRSLPALKKVDLLPPLQALLGWQRQQQLERLAPERLQVQSGSRIRLDYQSGKVPVLAVKLQELFGQADTPCVAGGKVPVLIHLLSPAGRPLQVTADLRNFWNSVYPEVKKEMKGRYPRHPWPDDPWSAEPTRRIKSRR